jgi:phage N-6-adenine-methyltransferase
MASSTGSPGSYPNGTTEWPTPQWLVDQLAEEFAPGGFDLDPAATPGNAKAPRFFTADDDGLAQPWHARAVCLNPPYGKTSTPRWLAKPQAEVDLGHAALVVCLVPARVSTRWWRECEADPQLFVRVIGGSGGPLTGAARHRSTQRSLCSASSLGGTDAARQRAPTLPARGRTASSGLPAVMPVPALRPAGKPSPGHRCAAVSVTAATR